jgi:hypothetical protein
MCTPPEIPSYEALLLPLEVVRAHVESAKAQLLEVERLAEARFGPVMATLVRLQVARALAALDMTYRAANEGSAQEWGAVSDLEDSIYRAEVETDEMALLLHMERAVGER